MMISNRPSVIVFRGNNLSPGQFLWNILAYKFRLTDTGSRDARSSPYSEIDYLLNFIKRSG